MVGEDNILFQIEDHEAFGQRVQGGAHVGWHGLGWIQVLEHPSQIQPEQNEGSQGHEHHELGQRVIEEGQPARGSERREAQLHLPPLFFSRPDRHFEMRIGRVFSAVFDPPMFADSDDGLATVMSNGSGNDLVIAFHDHAEYELQDLEVVLDDECRAVYCDRLGERRTALPNAPDAVRYQLKRHRSEQQGNHQKRESHGDMRFRIELQFRNFAFRHCLCCPYRESQLGSNRTVSSEHARESLRISVA